jgi:hypothetical protein
MKRQAVCSVMLIFLFMLALLFLGLNLCERGLQEVNGWDKQRGAFTLARGSGTSWSVTAAGREFSFNPAGIVIKLRHWYAGVKDWISTRLSASRSGAIMNWKLTGGAQCSGTKSGIFP